MSAKSDNEKKIFSLLNELDRAYNKIDKLKIENKILKNKLKQK
jgi:hypothetical protein